MKMVKKLARQLLTATVEITAFSSLSACATVMRSEHASWYVNSTPQGAEVTTSSGNGCPMTPCSIWVRRNANFTATVTLPGYQPQAVQVTPEVSAEGTLAFLGNAVIGGLLGAGIDLYTGAALDPSLNGQNLVLIGDGSLGDMPPQGCTAERRAYARKMRVPCEALGQKIDLGTLGPLSAD